MACGYATKEEVGPLITLSEEVGFMLNALIVNPGKLLLKQ